MRMAAALRIADAQPLTPLTTRLTMAGLHGADAAAVERLCDHLRLVPARQSLVREGDAGETIYVLLEGWAARVKHFADGRRQCTALVLPGDVCNLDALHVRAHDYGVVALTPCKVAAISRQQLGDLAAGSSSVAAALAWMLCIDNAIACEWIACVGRRSSRQHLAHLFCELLTRLAAVGEGDMTGFTMPLTQEEIADAMGITSVHVNRTVQGLRADGLISLDAHRLRVLDWPALQRVADFNPGYLHLDGIRPLN